MSDINVGGAELWAQPESWPFIPKVPPVVMGERYGELEVLGLKAGVVHVSGNLGQFAMPLNQYLNYRLSSCGIVDRAAEG